jgi:hypothetical protein
MPNRLIKESICTSEDIEKLSPMAEILFYRLIVQADDFGAYYGNAAIIKGNCFPLKSDAFTCEEVKGWLQELIDAGLIDAYKAGGRDYIQFHKWKNHQQIRAKKRKFPEPDNICCQMAADDSNGYHLISNDIKCDQMISNDSICARNPIQSNPKEESNPNPIQSKREYEADTGFDEFWKAYPKKSGDIRQAFIEFMHARETGVTTEEMVDAIRKQTEGTTQDSFRFLPSADNWLRNKAWLAKVPVATESADDTGNMFIKMLEERKP